MRLINEGALDAAGIDTLAARLGIGPRHLARLFKKHVGATPTQAAQTARVQRAKRLIDGTDLSMTEIALAAGFGSLRRFNALFAAIYQRPPSDPAISGPGAGSRETGRLGRVASAGRFLQSLPDFGHNHCFNDPVYEECTRMSELDEQTAAVDVGEPEAGRRQRLEAEPGEQPSGARIPRVGDDERTRLVVQRAESGRLFGTEQLIQGSTDLDATIRRLQAFKQAGADMLYAPGLRTLDQIRAVVSAVGKPVNVVMTHADPSLTLEQLSEAGVKRISIGGSGSRFALNAFMSAAREMAEHGSFTFVGENPPWRELLDGFAKGQG
jgi:AraC-like DNA-binding protein